jgi:hypothetical protein
MNWQTIIEDLLQRGYTLTTIGREIGTTCAAVRSMRIGLQKDTRWATGEKLINLHTKVMRRRSKQK